MIRVLVLLLGTSLLPHHSQADGRAEDHGMEDFSGYAQDYNQEPRAKKSFGSTRFGPPGRGGEQINMLSPAMLKTIANIMSGPQDPNMPMDQVLEEYGIRVNPETMAKIKLLAKMRVKNMLARRMARSQEFPEVIKDRDFKNVRMARWLYG